MFLSLKRRDSRAQWNTRETTRCFIFFDENWTNFQNPKLLINLPSFMKTEKPRAAYSAWYFFFYQKESTCAADMMEIQYNFQRRMSWLPHRWRTQRNAIRNANCRIQWIIKTLNASCASGIFLGACLLECLLTPPHPWCIFLVKREVLLRGGVWASTLNFLIKFRVVPRRGDLQLLTTKVVTRYFLKCWVAFNLVLRVWYFSFRKFKPNHQQQELFSPSTRGRSNSSKWL